MTSSSELSRLSLGATSIKSNASMGLASDKPVERHWSIPVGCNGIHESASTGDTHVTSHTEAQTSTLSTDTVLKENKPLREHTQPRSLFKRRNKKGLAGSKKHTCGARAEAEHSVNTKSTASQPPKIPTPSSSTPTRTRRKGKWDKGKANAVLPSPVDTKSALDTDYDEPSAWPPGHPPLELGGHLLQRNGRRKGTKPRQESLPQTHEARLSSLFTPLPLWASDRVYQDVGTTATPRAPVCGGTWEPPIFNIVDAIHPDESYPQMQAADQQDLLPVPNSQLLPDLADVQRWITDSRTTSSLPVSNSANPLGPPPRPTAPQFEGLSEFIRSNLTGENSKAQRPSTSPSSAAAPAREGARASVERKLWTPEQTSGENHEQKAPKYQSQGQPSDQQGISQQGRGLHHQVIEQLESLVQILMSEVSRMIDTESELRKDLHSIEERTRRNRELESRKTAIRSFRSRPGPSPARPDTKHIAASRPTTGDQYMKHACTPIPPPSPSRAPRFGSRHIPHHPAPPGPSSVNTEKYRAYNQESTQIAANDNNEQESAQIAVSSKTDIPRKLNRTDSAFSTSHGVGEASGLRNRRSGGGATSENTTVVNLPATKHAKAGNPSSSDPERGAEAAGDGAVWLSNPDEEPVLVDTRSGVQMSKFLTRTPFIGSPPDNAPFQPSPRQLIGNEHLFQEQEFDDSGRQSMFSHHDHRDRDHRDRDTSRPNLRDCHSRPRSLYNGEKTVVLYRRGRRAQSPHSTERRSRSVPRHGRRTRTTHSSERQPHSIKCLEYNPSKVVAVDPISTHDRLLEYPPPQPQLPVTLFSRPPTTSIPRVYQKSPFEVVSQSQVVSPDTFRVWILLPSQSSGLYKMLRTQPLKKNEMHDRALFQEIKSTYHGFRGLRRRFSFKGVTDIQFCQVCFSHSSSTIHRWLTPSKVCTRWTSTSQHRRSRIRPSNCPPTITSNRLRNLYRQSAPPVLLQSKKPPPSKHSMDNGIQRAKRYQANAKGPWPSREPVGGGLPTAVRQLLRPGNSVY